jgi:hypothetical protein
VCILGIPRRDLRIGQCDVEQGEGAQAHRGAGVAQLSR